MWRLCFSGDDDDSACKKWTMTPKVGNASIGKIAKVGEITVSSIRN
jgi:hypothetical protein